MTNKVELRQLEEIRVAFIPYKGEMLKANKVFPSVFKAIRGKVSGAPIFCYLSADEKAGTADMELCVPTAETPQGAGVQVKNLPSVQAVCVTHTGPYTTMHTAYQQIEEYALAKGLKLKRPVREVFIKGPGMLVKGNPEHYITEIQFPIEEA